MTTDSRPRLDQSGRRLGRYELFRAIARGGMATVHLGRLLGPVGFARTVAIKRLHEQFAADPEFVSMFVDEARLAARIHHPNVVQTLDVVDLEGELFIVMEYVHGDSLSRLARAAKDMDPRLGASIVAGALQGLHAAHEAKSETGEPLSIVHRDVSPQNILVGTDGVPRVLDFGVARAAKRIQSTSSGEIKGKVRYMPPEQLRGELVDRRADIYAAGIVLFETLTGTRYTNKEEPAAIILETITGPPTAPSSRKPGLPPALDAIVLKALAPRREDRFDTAEEMALAIEESVGLVSPARIARWVAEVAGTTLAERAKLVSEVEQALTNEDPTVPQRSSSPDLVRTSSPDLVRRSSPDLVRRSSPDLVRRSSPDLSVPVEAPSGVSNIVAALPPRPGVKGAWVALGIVGVLGTIAAVATIAESSGPRPATAVSAPPPSVATTPTEVPSAKPLDPPTDIEIVTIPAPSASVPATPAKAGTRKPSTPRPSTTEDLFRRRR